MGIKCSISSASLKRYFIKSHNIIAREIKRALSRLGVECVKAVRDRSAEDSWEDQTGNLRSSIGYAVYNYGKVEIESAFAVVKDGTEGAEVGKQVIEELANLYADTYALVILAGMEYASDVEAIKSKDVLASTELWAKSVISERMQKAKEKAIQEINNLTL